MPSKIKQLASPALLIFLVAFVAAIVVGLQVAPTWTVEKTALEVETDEETGRAFINYQDEAYYTLGEAIPASKTPLTVEKLTTLFQQKPKPQVDPENPPTALDKIVAFFSVPRPEFTEQLVVETVTVDGEQQQQYSQLTAQRHWGWWSFLPALTAIALCWITKEPITALLAGIVVGAMLICQFNIFDGVLIKSIGTARAAKILILYLWLLGGLMGIWAKTGASEAFADYMSKNFVRGPRSAKLVAWFLGVIFFQGGTVSAVLVGTTVRPLADEEKVCHEELSLIVDSTSSPIAVLLAFNAWPLYVQAFIGVAGVSYLATEADRVAFFFGSIWYSFYAILAVLATFLIAIEKHPALPKKLKQARLRALETGELNAPDSEPLAGEDPNYDFVPEGFTPSIWDFVLPLAMLLGVAIGTYQFLGSPKVLWAFGAALMLSVILAALRGMKLHTIVAGIIDGQKGVVLGSVILLLAITVGDISQNVGGGRYLVSLLGNLELFWILPATAFSIAVVIAFSTGTSWATFAVTLPLVMPLAYAVSINNNLTHPEQFLMICFAACLNGGVFGDQCSPISDTTILSSMCTGADLMDHVTTQIPVAFQAAVLAVIGWTGLAWYCA